MGRTVAAYQPRYYPRLHYLARAQQADVFIIYDDVEFSRKSPKHRAVIGEKEEYLTIPVKHSDSNKMINEVEVDLTKPWIDDHLNSLESEYGEQALMFKKYYENLFPDILRPKYVRNNPPEKKFSHKEDLIKNFKRRDRKWRKLKSQVDELRAKKNDIAEKIGKKSNKGGKSTEDLIKRSKQISQELEKLEEKRDKANKKRYETLIKISESHSEGEYLNHKRVLEVSRILEIKQKAKLVDITIPILEKLLDKFQVDSKIVKSSEIDVQHPGDPSEYLARLTEKFEGDYYLSGRRGFENYMKKEPFEKRNSEIIVQDWEPKWPNGNVCCLEVLFNAENPHRYIT